MPAWASAPRAATPRGKIQSATTINGIYDSALTTKQPIAPTLTSSTPAMAGPRMRDRLNWVELSASPVAICLCSTIEGTIDWNDGIDNASVTPTTSDNTMIIHGRTVPIISNTTRITGQSICAD